MDQLRQQETSQEGCRCGGEWTVDQGCAGLGLATSGIQVEAMTEAAVTGQTEKSYLLAQRIGV